METIINYIKEHWILCLIGGFLSAGLLISLLTATSSATARKQKPTETEPQEDTTLPEWDITDTITNKK
jgi:hypothetical protein